MHRIDLDIRDIERDHVHRLCHDIADRDRTSRASSRRNLDVSIAPAGQRHDHGGQQNHALHVDEGASLTFPITIDAPDVANGQYTARITLTRRKGGNAVTVQVRYVKQQGNVTLGNFVQPGEHHLEVRPLALHGDREQPSDPRRPTSRSVSTTVKAVIRSGTRTSLLQPRLPVPPRSTGTARCRRRSRRRSTPTLRRNRGGRLPAAVRCSASHESEARGELTDGRGPQGAPSQAAHPPLRPRVGRRGVLGRAHRRTRAAPLGARGHPAGRGALRRLDRDPLLVSRGDLRLVRRPHQRPARPGVPHAPRQGPGGLARRRDRGRADRQHARAQGPDRRHGPGPLEEIPARHAVARQQGADPRARVHRPGLQHGRRHADDCIQCGACVSTASRWRSTRSSSARRRWRAYRSPATRATPHSERPQRPRRGSARHLRLHALLQCIEACPKGVAPMARSCACAAWPATITRSRTATTGAATRSRS